MASEPHGLSFAELPHEPAEQPSAINGDGVPARPAVCHGQRVSLDGKDDSASERQKAKPKETPSSPKVSEAFQALLDQLLEQHLTEVAGCPQVLRNRRPSLEHGASTKSFSSGQVLRMESLNNLMRRRRQSGVVEVNASDILNAWEETDSTGSADMLSDPITRLHFNLNGTAGSLDPVKEESRLKRLQNWLQSSQFEFIMAGVLFVNVAWMALELQMDGGMAGAELRANEAPPVSPEVWPAWESAFSTGDVIFALLFVFDVIVRICVLRTKFWKVWMNYVDAFVSVTSVLEIYVATSTETTLPNAVLIRLIRIGKLARAIRVLSMSTVLASLQLLVKCLTASSNILFWSFILLAFVQCVAGMVLSMLVWDFIRDPKFEVRQRDEIYQYYGTFTRSILSMFEIMFANWGPPCRVLVENVSEWFTVFFLFYRCILGFAVLNVVNSVFVQQTMKTASSDEELAFRQKERDIALYHRKVRKLFQTMDCTGDGAINLEEFAKLVQSPKLKFWMSQLELEYHDLLSLFEFLDNGDGQITLTEFIEGSARLRGNAKAIDIWRLETKLEVLFEEVLNRLKAGGNADGWVDASGDGSSVVDNSRDVEMSFSSVEEAFHNSAYQHIKTTSKSRPIADAVVHTSTSRSQSPTNDKRQRMFEAAM